MVSLIYRIKGVVNIEEYDLTLWEIAKNCYSGGYIGGEVFESESGGEIYFDGQSLKNFENFNIKEKFRYVRYL